MKKQALRKQWLMTSETHPDFHLFEHSVLSHPTHSTLLENISARTKPIKTRVTNSEKQNSWFAGNFKHKTEYCWDNGSPRKSLTKIMWEPKEQLFMKKQQMTLRKPWNRGTVRAHICSEHSHVSCTGNLESWEATEICWSVRRWPGGLQALSSEVKCWQN